MNIFIKIILTIILSIILTGCNEHNNNDKNKSDNKPIYNNSNDSNDNNIIGIGNVDTGIQNISKWSYIYSPKSPPIDNCTYGLSENSKWLVLNCVSFKVSNNGVVSLNSFLDMSNSIINDLDLKQGGSGFITSLNNTKINTLNISYNVNELVIVNATIKNLNTKYVDIRSLLSLENTTITNANFSNTEFYYANFSNSIIRGANFFGDYFRDLNNLNFNNVDLTDINFTCAIFETKPTNLTKINRLFKNAINIQASKGFLLDSNNQILSINETNCPNPSTDYYDSDVLNSYDYYDNRTPINSIKIILKGGFSYIQDNLNISKTQLETFKCIISPLPIDTIKFSKTEVDEIHDNGVNIFKDLIINDNQYLHEGGIMFIKCPIDDSESVYYNRTNQTLTNIKWLSLTLHGGGYYYDIYTKSLIMRNGIITRHSGIATIMGFVIINTEMKYD